MSKEFSEVWTPADVPIAVVMISLNEAHNMDAVLENLKGFAAEVFLVDSYSSDETVDIALAHGVHVVQRKFRGFGDQWNFAMRELPITAPWTMKLDPDERLSDELKAGILSAIDDKGADGFIVSRRLWFMGRRLPVKHELLRVWRTGSCHFTDVLVNEHPVVGGAVTHVSGELQHHDSPDLDHWLDKQNRYTTAEAITAHTGGSLGAEPALLGTPLQRRMWIKRNFMKFPLRYSMIFTFHYCFLGAWRAGYVGYVWARLRCDVYRLWEYKLREIQLTGRMPVKRPNGPGCPDLRVKQFG
ncbi:glycosyltransferase family 2 protein [Hoeflea sp.]|uniref:glycosyltransferase family 2 protein n=1 Tax=Hoeflea sp. TaxID=1940281 RepID=UPI00198BF134|nr:glycosyltransferase family 2 protein [Hoeflea sp.]MBC7285470.1 glycosyltransferase family 2 protein [Hoeflea sp.]